MNPLVMLLLVFFAVIFAVGAYRRVAISKTWYDLPNQRSSHRIPTPGGAGIALAAVVISMHVLTLRIEGLESELVAMLLLASGMALMGWFDDRVGLPTVPRALIYASASLCMSFILLEPSSPWGILAAGSVFAYVNFFNFMDGTDGIASSQCLFIAIGLALLGDGSTEVVQLSTILAVASAAFLCWNWAPAKVFLGDAGSLFFGFLLASLALKLHVDNVVHISISLLLSVLFIAEPLTVMIMRAMAGENVTQAHRSHVYQLLAARWNSHARVALTYLVLNCGLVLPLVFYIRAKSTEGTIITVGVFLLCCLIVGILRHRLLLSSAEKI